ncbi:hypothetical protein [Moraxella nonliquefaciens]|nr:hypothetical protein [Moraxella nonliquefaciens]
MSKSHLAYRQACVGSAQVLDGVGLINGGAFHALGREWIYVNFSLHLF